MNLVQEQDRRVWQGESKIPKAQNCLERIRALYKNDRMSIANDDKQFDKNRHDGLRHNNRLYLRGDRLAAFFPSANIGEIAEVLESQGVLETGKDARTKQISSLSGMRFYVIPLRYLS